MVLLVAGCLLHASAAGAAIYRCTVKGKVSYRDVPCGSKEKQTRLGQGEMAGCYQIDDISEWEGGSGRWVVRIAADGEAYQLREYFPADDLAARQADPVSVPLRRATLDELDAVALQYHVKATSGFVLDTPGTGILGLFNTWNPEGEVRLIGLFAFANGQAERVACP